MAHLTDMEELLATIESQLIRNYMREAMSCYMAGAYRGCIVLSYIALFDDLLDKLGKLAGINSAAKTIYNEAKKRKDDQDVFESFLIDQLGSKNLLSGLDAAFLDTLRSLRNKSAHPSGHTPSPEEARFIFYESITRFLARPILSTTQLVDELIQRMSNSNVFPSSAVPDLAAIVQNEIETLHEEAIPQLVAKLVKCVIDTDAVVQRNSTLFLVGLAGLKKGPAKEALTKKLLEAKADATQYAASILGVLTADGSLAGALSGVHLTRVKSLLAAQIVSPKVPADEYELGHPVSIVASIVESLDETTLLASFKEEIERLFEKRPYSSKLGEAVKKHTVLAEMWVATLFENAGSSTFDIANAFAVSVSRIDGVLASAITNEKAFHFVVAVCRAADWNAYSSKDLVSKKFVTVPAVRAKAISYLNAKKKTAKAYLETQLSIDMKASAFVAAHLT
ncbi:hypothetical protein DFR24_3288 [Panacagrimonas perspica]|uniref:Uncharacterized protein n=1 Tax=Panacagrimonas perspica TaxID=381431 RepID=A0A4R7P5D0_9GAMM|nr:hypothetical protein [Panacagrimonas perspica]TDU28908.1 hypothetical protein DFR24_3288 [Panacagrimonas perspica]THD02267.1 hypothetical protein B1810_15170 [Panacagrimonas perspica]